MTVHSKSFTGVPHDPDTKIIEQREISIKSLPCIFQRWCWESINASSCIFHTFDVQSFSDDQLQALIAESELSNTLGTKTIAVKTISPSLILTFNIDEGEKTNGYSQKTGI